MGLRLPFAVFRKSLPIAATPRYRYRGLNFAQWDKTGRSKTIPDRADNQAKTTNFEVLKVT